MKTFFAVVFSFIVFSGIARCEECVVTTKLDHLCVTVPEVKSYYLRYKKDKLSVAGKGNWYFTLADLIDATKSLAFEKILTHEAEKSGVDRTAYFERYRVELQKNYRQIDRYVKKLVSDGKLSKKEAAVVEGRLRRAIYLRYLKKAYLNMKLADYLKVTSDDIAGFMEAHKGEYGFKKDSKHPDMKVISKVDLVKLIREEKRARVARAFAESLWKKYGVTLNKRLLKELDRELDDR
ncbi:hypothetical protein [Desulfurobacterium sp.]